MVDTSIPLIIGDPAQNPATFTRFVLPFSYSLRPGEAQPRGTYYRQVGELAAEPERRSYLMPETADALFQRAKWFRLEGPDTVESVKAQCRDGHEILVQLAPPQLVLFEAVDALSATLKRSGDSHDEEEILRTGFVMLDLYFPDGETVKLDHLLELNELFRYWYCPFPDHSSRKGYWRLLHGSYGRAEPHPGAHDLYLERWAGLLAHPVQFSKGRGFARLFPSAWDHEAKVWIENRTGAGNLMRCGWIAVPDPRAFVWTCAITNSGGNDLRGSASPPPPETLGAWVALLNVDFPAGPTASPFEQVWAGERTYTRWAHYGTFYGFCSHAGAVMAPPIEEPPVWRQFATMHFDQTLFLLYLRVTTFRFSRRLSEVSGRASSAGFRHDQRLLEDFRRLRWSFALFTNLYQFPLLSSQEQGIEMYEKARKHMDIDALFKEIQQEIEASEQYLNAVMQEQQTSAQVVLSVVATLGLAVALVLAWRQIAADEASWLIRWGYPTAIAAVGLLASITFSRRLAGLFSWLSHWRRK